MAKKCLRWAIAVVLSSHLLLVVDCPVVCVATSALTHTSYLRLTRSYPFISTMSPPFLVSAGARSHSHTRRYTPFAHHSVDDHEPSPLDAPFPTHRTQP